MKKLSLKRISLLLSFVILFSLSCKKDNAVADPAKDAKSWYLKSTANTNSILKSNRGDVKNITLDIQWSDAKLYNLEDGTEVVGTPMVITSKKGIRASGSYMLLISKTNGAYSSLIAYNENKDYFKRSLTDLAVQNIYKTALELILTHKDISASPSNSNPNNKLMTVPAGGYCIDWYMTTYVYDSWGNIVEILSETYLYTTCTEEGGGGVVPEPEDPDPNCTNATGSISSEQASENLSSALGEESAGKRPAEYKWVFLKNTFGLWKYISTEDGIHKKVGSNWQWDTLTHRDIARSGLVVGATITTTITHTNAIVGTYAAGMELTYSFNSSMLCQGFPISADATGTVASPVWQISN